MARHERRCVEDLFRDGVLRLVVCTATLAWGVNLPAHTVVIKGTDVFRSEDGGASKGRADLSILDVQQIFGRAGRPQYDATGEAVLVATQDKVADYLRQWTAQTPIESRLGARLPDHLNAEVVLGTVASADDAATWLGYSFMFLRAKKAPLVYGITPADALADPNLSQWRGRQARKACEALDDARMARWDPQRGTIAPTELGRIAARCYVAYDTMRTWARDSPLDAATSADSVFAVIARAGEFAGMRVRDEEKEDLARLAAATGGAPRHRANVDAGTARREAEAGVSGPSEPHEKALALLRAWVGGVEPRTPSLSIDMASINDSAPRLLAALFSVAMYQRSATAITHVHTARVCLDRRIPPSAHPLAQFGRAVPPSACASLAAMGATPGRIMEMTPAELQQIVRTRPAADCVAHYVRCLPEFEIEVAAQPVTATILRVRCTLSAKYRWSRHIHGAVDPFWLVVGDSETPMVHHCERLLVGREHARGAEPLVCAFTIATLPVSTMERRLPAMYTFSLLGERWLGTAGCAAYSTRHLRRPVDYQAYCELLPLAPLPVSALGIPEAVRLYPHRYFNATQTQYFHTLFHTDHSALVGAPTGSGKTTAAEIAALRLFLTAPGRSVVYIAPLKALVAERLRDWGARLGGILGRKVVELSGDAAPDLAALNTADVVVATPEKWDGVSRGWERRRYVRRVGLVVLDEVHLLGEDRGPILEVIVSRMRYIAWQTGQPVRFVAMSTAVSNAGDVAEWLGVRPDCVFNFRPHIRPVPMTVHIAGFPGEAWCPRMMAMNRPAYLAVGEFSGGKPVLVFVPSRRQTRLTAMALRDCLIQDGRAGEWCALDAAGVAAAQRRAKDPALRELVGFGVLFHHAGLAPSDKALVEELFGCHPPKARVLVATSTLAWGVNLPAHMVVVKGTEFFDKKKCGYVDYPTSEILQMIGRAGRPQFDTTAVAKILCADAKKAHLRKFLYDPYPVESHLPAVFPIHLNAEVASGTVRSRADALEYLSWTFLYRRLPRNPAYYLDEAERDADPDGSGYFGTMVDAALGELERALCVESAGDAVAPTALGRIAAEYYVSPSTVYALATLFECDADVDAAGLLLALTRCAEFAETPCRHGEDELNAALAAHLAPLRHGAGLPAVVGGGAGDDSHVKALLLLHAWVGRQPLPNADYETDTKGVLDNAMRVVAAAVDVAAAVGALKPALRCMRLAQMLCQGVWHDDDPYAQLPSDSPPDAIRRALGGVPFASAALEAAANPAALAARLRAARVGGADAVATALRGIPVVTLSATAAVAPPKRATSAAAAAEDGGEGPAAEGEEVDAAPRVVVRCVTTAACGRTSGSPSCLRLHKPTRVAWWYLVADAASGQLLGVRRGGAGGGAVTVEIAWDVAARPLPGEYRLAVLCVCDAVAGVDAACELTVALAPPQPAK